MKTAAMDSGFVGILDGRAVGCPILDIFAPPFLKAVGHREEADSVDGLDARYIFPRLTICPCSPRTVFSCVRS